MDISYYKKYEPIDGKWYITKALGKGAFGTVFEIERRDFDGEKSALKIISIPASQSEVDSYREENFELDKKSVTSYFYGFVEEFTKEFRLMSKLKGNSNIVSIEDYDVKKKENEIGWDIFIRMELLTPINKYFQSHAPTQKEIIKLGIDICKALEICKNQQIVHRDIKPSNIFISPNGDFKLGDFGVARTLEKTSGALSKKGTYTYMAPEVYKGEAYNASIDLYSLGIVMYKLLNNNYEPFRTEKSYGDEEKALVYRMKGEKRIPNPANADADLSEIIIKACNFSPSDRYREPSEMRADLERLLSLKKQDANDVEIKGFQSDDIDEDYTFGIFEYVNNDPTDKNNIQDNSGSSNADEDESYIGNDETVGVFGDNPDPDIITTEVLDSKNDIDKKNREKMLKICIPVLVIVLIAIQCIIFISLVTNEDDTKISFVAPIVQTDSTRADNTTSSSVVPDTSGGSAGSVPVSVSEIVAKYNDVVNSTKRIQRGMVKITDSRYVNCTDCSLTVMTDTVELVLKHFVENAMPNRNGTFTFGNEDFSAYAYMFPIGSDASLKEEYVESATAVAMADGYKINIILKPESPTIDGTVISSPPGNESCLGSDFVPKWPESLPLIRGSMQYPGTALIATFNRSGVLTSLDVSFPFYGSARSRSGSLTFDYDFEGAFYERYKFTYY